MLFTTTGRGLERLLRLELAVVMVPARRELELRFSWGREWREVCGESV